MLVVVLNHNLPDLTDNCASQLQRSIGDNELWVLDNGSDKAPLAKSTTHTIPQNVYLGGAFRVALDYFKQSNHDHLFFLNNDLIFHGYNFIPTILNEIQTHDIALYSPSVINAGPGQCHWKTMWNWGTGTVREVPFIDFQSPVIRKDLALAINDFPPELFHYGLDFYSCLIANKNNLKIGVSDNLTICHLENQTAKNNLIEGFTENSFPSQANTSMINYFMSSPYKDKFLELREKGSQYNA